MIRIAIGVAFVVLVAIGYSVWPYHSGRQLLDAVQAGDVATVNRKIEWVELRASIKDMMASQMQKAMLEDIASGSGDNELGVGLAAMIGPAFVDRMVDSMVTPANLGNFFASQKIAHAGASGRPRFRKGSIKRAGLVSLTRFEIWFGHPEEAEPTLLAVLRLRDLDWKLTELVALKPLN